MREGDGQLLRLIPVRLSRYPWLEPHGNHNVRAIPQPAEDLPELPPFLLATSHQGQILRPG